MVILKAELLMMEEKRREMNITQEIIERRAGVCNGLLFTVACRALPWVCRNNPVALDGAGTVGQWAG